MKRISSISTFIIAMGMITCLLPGCKKENNYPSKTVTFSLPVITLNGPAIIVLNHGDVFVDPGGTWTDSATGEHGTVTSNTPVNTTTDGLFVITYTAVNKYGLKATATRDVAVTGISAVFDISGIYLRVGSSPPDDTANITKIGRGLFQTDNVGGNIYHESAVFLIQTDSTILVPNQTLSLDGPATFQSAMITYTPPPITISWAVIASGYGSYVRTFQKQ